MFYPNLSGLTESTRDRAKFGSIHHSLMKLFPVTIHVAMAMIALASTQAKDTTLVVEIQAPIMAADGKQIGSVKLPVGSTVTIVSIESDGVMVSRGGGTPFKVAKDVLSAEAAVVVAATPIPAQSPIPISTPATATSISKPTGGAIPASQASLSANSSATQPLRDEVETNITCELTRAPRYSEVPVLHSDKEAQNTLGTYHYKLWLPKGYNADINKQWPCMFIMSPEGNASMGEMANYLGSNGFVVVMLVEAKNGPWEPIIGNFLAAHDDVIKRVRIAEDKKYATGLSGGARASSVFVQLRRGFRGLILQGAGASFDDKNNYQIAGILRNAKLRIAMTMGSSDNNKNETDRMKKLFGRQSLAVFDFTGGHTWAPAEVFEKAMIWLNGSNNG